MFLSGYLVFHVNFFGPIREGGGRKTLTISFKNGRNAYRSHFFVGRRSRFRLHSRARLLDTGSLCHLFLFVHNTILLLLYRMPRLSFLLQGLVHRLCWRRVHALTGDSGRLHPTFTLLNRSKAKNPHQKHRLSEKTYFLLQ